MTTTKQYFKVNNGLEVPALHNLSATNSSGPAVNPSLLLDFANTRQLDPRVTFSRSSTGTFYDGSSSPAEHNLLTYSQDFDNNAWSKGTQIDANSTTVNSNVLTAPDGTLTADLLIENASVLTVHKISQPYATAGAFGTFTFSIYAKANTRTRCTIVLSEGPTTDNGVYATANLSLGIIDVPATVFGTGWSAISSTIIALNDSWYRISITANKSNPGAVYGEIQLDKNTSGSIMNSYLGDGSSIYIWGAQLEQRSSLTSYTPTTSKSVTNYIPVLKTALVDQPRFDVDPITLESKGLLIEEQRTNLLVGSNNFEKNFWGLSNSAVLSAITVAPDGSSTANLFSENTADSAYHYIQQTRTKSATSLSYTLSLYVKYAGRNIGLRLQELSPGTSGAVLVFNPNTGSFTTTPGTYGTTFSSASGAITNVGYGWYRISLTVTTGTETTIDSQLFLTNSSGSSVYTGTANTGVYIWGAQLEQGNFATSYIPTPMVYTGRSSFGSYKSAEGYLKYAAPDTMRYEVNSFGALQPLLESAAINLLPYTNDFSAWNKLNSFISSNVTVAPDNTFTADQITSTTNAGYYSYTAPSYTANTTHTLSMYMKAGTSTTGGLYFASSSANATYSLSGSGTTSATNGTSTITPVGNGWYRCTLTATPTVASNIGFYVVSATAGDSIYIWGAQLETGSVATSYIPSVETFTSRLSPGTFYDAGSVAIAEQNLVTNSQDLSSGSWIKSAATVTANTVAAPDGTITADTVAETATGSVHGIVGSTFSAVVNSSYTMSAYLKKGAGATAPNILQFLFSNSMNSTAYANFNIGTGVTGTTVGGTSSITSVGNGWYRCTFTVSALNSYNSSSPYIIFVNNNDSLGRYPSYTGATTSDVYVWGVQVEQRSTATSYTPTTSSPITNFIPSMRFSYPNNARYDYDPVTRKSKGLLNEAAATNLFTYSEDFGDVSWSRLGNSVITNYIVAPTGVLAGDYLVESLGTDSQHRIGTTVVSAVPTVQNNLSVFVKTAGRSQIMLYMDAGSSTYGSVYATFNISTGTASTVTATNGATAGSSTITPVGNGWYRISVSGIPSTIGSNTRCFIYFGNTTANQSYIGDGFSGIYIWGAQLETGLVATSYIPTTGISTTRSAESTTSSSMSRTADVYTSYQVTRSTDSARVTGTNFSSWANQDGGTIYCEFSSFSSLNGGQSVAINKYPIIWLMYGSNVYWYGSSAEIYIGNTYNNLGGVPTLQFNKLAVSLAPAGGQSYVTLNGSTPSAKSGTVLPSSTLEIGGNGGSSANAINGNIKKLAIYPKQLSIIELQGITS